MKLEISIKQKLLTVLVVGFCLLSLNACEVFKRKYVDPKVGMTQEQIVSQTRWGAPWQKKTLNTSGGRTEIWYWGPSNGSWIMFQNGVVTAVYE